jgi:hypothetical protein
MPKKRTTRPTHRPADFDPPLAARRSYRVRLPGVPQQVIDDCATREEAYHRYKQQNGILDSDHDPQIDLVPSKPPE